MKKSLIALSFALMAPPIALVACEKKSGPQKVVPKSEATPLSNQPQAPSDPVTSKNSSSPSKRIEPKSELEFVYIPGIHLWFGKTEVTVAAYERCVNAGFCQRPNDFDLYKDNEEIYRHYRHRNYGVPGRSNHPMNSVQFQDSKKFCEWIGGRLPTEEEWKYAATGGLNRKYPWGDAEPSGSLANYGKDTEVASGQGTTPVGSYSPAGDSPHGLQDMAGNVWEWTSTPYPDEPEDSGEYIVKGGSWLNTSSVLSVSYRDWFNPTPWDEDYGFRCLLPSK